MPTPHIESKKEDIAKVVLMPGDPLRAKMIAEKYLDNPRLVNSVRNILAYTGTYKGKEVTVFSSGMGNASIGIYSYELYNVYDVDNIIRIGSAGAFDDDLNLMDIVLGMGSCTDSNFAAQYNLPGIYAPIADFTLLKTAYDVAEEKHFSVKVGNVLASDVFYNDDTTVNDRWKKMGVLAVDMDPQGNTTSGFGVDKNGIENTLYELLLGEAETKDTIVKDVVENLDLIPSNINLSGAEIELVGIDDKEFILKGITDKLRRKYDYIILDCPPSLNMLTINALTAATSVLVPIQCEYYALEGLSQLIHTIDLVKERLNKRLKMEGVVFTMYDARTNLSLQVVENVKENLNQNIYKTIIPRNVRLAEAPSYGQPINIYDPRSAGAESYRLLAEEVLNREDN